MERRPSRRWLPLTALGLPLLAGCYSYVPVRLESVPLGSAVRAYLSPQATASVNSRIGVDARALSGRLTDMDERQAVFLVRSPGTGSQPGSTVLYQRVDVALPDVARVDVRVFSRVRTGGLVAALLGVAAVWAVRTFGGNRPGSPPLDGGGPVE